MKSLWTKKCWFFNYMENERKEYNFLKYGFHFVLKTFSDNGIPITELEAVSIYNYIDSYFKISLIFKGKPYWNLYGKIRKGVGKRISDNDVVFSLHNKEIATPIFSLYFNHVHEKDYRVETWINHALKNKIGVFLLDKEISFAKKHCIGEIYFNNDADIVKKIYCKDGFIAIKNKYVKNLFYVYQTSFYSK